MFICFKLIVSGKNVVHASKYSSIFVCVSVRAFSIIGVLKSPSPLAAEHTLPLSLNKMCSTHLCCCAPVWIHSEVLNIWSVTSKLSSAPTFPGSKNSRDICLSCIVFFFNLCNFFSTVLKQKCTGWTFCLPPSSFLGSCSPLHPKDFTFRFPRHTGMPLWCNPNRVRRWIMLLQACMGSVFTINIAIHKSAFSEERKYGAGEDAKV